MAGPPVEKWAAPYLCVKAQNIFVLRTEERNMDIFTKNSTVTLFLVFSCFALFGQTTYTTSQTVSAPSSGSVQIECWGGGGGGGGASNASGDATGGGGGGGAYSKLTYSINAGDNVVISIGAGGASGNSSGGNGGTGGTSSVTVPLGSVSALGGFGGAGSTCCAGAAGAGGNGGTGFLYKGGNGASGLIASTNKGGGGGGSAGIGSNGNNAGAQPAGGTAVAGGVAGGNGGNPGCSTCDAVGGSGNLYGGGGGGASVYGNCCYAGGAGGQGKVILTWIACSYPAAPSAISGNTAPCQGTSQTYSVTSTGATTFTWAFPSGWVQTGGGTTGTVTVTVGSGSGNIGVTPSNACGSTTSQTLAVVVLAQPSAITGVATPCQNSSQVYSVTNLPGITYTWSFPSGWTQTAGGTSNSVTVIVGSTSGTISVTPSTVSCGSGTSSTISTTVQSLPCSGALYINNSNNTYTIPCGSVNKFYDAGGSGGNYSNSQNYTTTLCAPAGQYISVIFNDFNTESGTFPSGDHLFIYNGATIGSPLLGDYYGGNLPPIYWSSSTGGCLTFNFISDGSYSSYRGFSADAVCTNAPVNQTPNSDCANQTCLGAGPIIINSGNTGSGSVNDLPNATVMGCLSTAEKNTSWYFFDIATSGTLQLDIFPNPSSKDYDFALFKLSGGCPTSAPIRCSYSAPGGTTGINSLQNASQSTCLCPTGGPQQNENSENDQNGNNWVNDLPVIAGEHYVLVVGDYTSSGASSASIALTGSATFNCTSVLPIELISFKGKCNSEFKTFSWSTASEINNDFFTIEGSNDAMDFQALNIITGAGNSHSVKHYENSIMENQYKYFRLKQTDFDGHFSYSETITVSCNFHNEIFGDLSVYPNPATNNLTLNFGSEINSKLQIRIKDLLGMKIKEINYQADGVSFINISLEDFGKGIYFIQVNDLSNNFTAPLLKFIKE